MKPSDALIVLGKDEDLAQLKRDRCPPTGGPASVSRPRPLSDDFKELLEASRATSLGGNVDTDGSRRFQLAQPRELLCELSEDAAREIEGLLETWTASLRGLTKGVTRIRITSLIREVRPLDPGAVVDHSRLPAPVSATTH